MKLFTEALDVREIDSSDWYRFFFSWLVIVFVLLSKMPLSSRNIASLKNMIQDKTNCSSETIKQFLQHFSHSNEMKDNLSRQNIV